MSLATRRPPLWPLCVMVLAAAASCNGSVRSGGSVRPPDSGGTAASGGVGGGGTGGTGGTGGAAPPGTYRWYPRLQLDRIPFHAGAGAWGPHEPITAPEPPNITNGDFVVRTEPEWAAARGNGRRLIVPAGATIDADQVVLSHSDVEVVIEDGARAPAIFVTEGSRIRIRGEHMGRTGTGRVGTIDMGAAATVTDVIIDGLRQTGSAMFTHPGRNVSRVSFTNMLVHGDLALLNDTQDLVIAGCNVVSPVQFWILRVQGATRRLVVFESHLENHNNALYRQGGPVPPLTAGATWFGDSTLVNSTQSNPTATGEVVRILSGAELGEGPMDSVWIDNCRIHANAAGSNGAEIAPRAGFCGYYRHVGGMVVNDMPWSPDSVMRGAGPNEQWMIDTTVVGTAGNPIPPWTDRNASGDPTTLVP